METKKNLAEALLMLSIIILVLVSTTDFANPSTKTLIMISLGILAVIMGILRVWCGMQEVKKKE